jgi:hypothetical protein
MTLYDIVMATLMQQTITAIHYITEETLIDCETVHNVLGSTRFYRELQHLQVYKLEIGKTHGDLVLHVCDK